MKKVLFITKKRNNPYGISYGLLNSAQFVAQALERVYRVPSKVVEVDDNNGIDKEVFLFRPTHVIIEALWVVPSKIEVLIKLYKHVHWTIRIHSKAPFLANEGIAMQWIDEYLQLGRKYKNLTIGTNNKDFNHDLRKVLHCQADYLPNIYMPKREGNPTPRQNRCHLHIGCFGAIRPLKNQFEQAIAAIIFANSLDKELYFHINHGRLEQRGEEVFKNLRNLFAATHKHHLVEHEWTQHWQFEHLVRSMDIGMQVSMSESFNIVTADFVHNGIPVVVSDDIDWIPSWWRCSPTDTNAIVDRLNLTQVFTGTCLNRMALWRYNRKSLHAWARYLKI